MLALSKDSREGWVSDQREHLSDGTGKIIFKCLRLLWGVGTSRTLACRQQEAAKEAAYGLTTCLCPSKGCDGANRHSVISQMLG